MCGLQLWLMLRSSLGWGNIRVDVNINMFILMLLSLLLWFWPRLFHRQCCSAFLKRSNAQLENDCYRSTRTKFEHVTPAKSEGQ